MTQVFKSNHFLLKISIVGKWNHKNQEGALSQKIAKNNWIDKAADSRDLAYSFNPILKIPTRNFKGPQSKRWTNMIKSQNHSMCSWPRFFLFSPYLDVFHVLDMQLIDSSCVAFGINASVCGKQSSLLHPLCGTLTWAFFLEARVAHMGSGFCLVKESSAFA